MTDKRAVAALLIALTMATTFIFAKPAMSLSIGGAVRQPLNLTGDDLVNLEQTEVKLCEITRDGRFRGVFAFRGVPLRNLLQMATIQKEAPGFSKPIDLAVVIRDKSGKRAILSWGEIFYGKPSDVIIAITATPVMPSSPKGCGECHTPTIYQPTLDMLGRKIGLPKLVVSDDFYSDRCLEDVVHIEVIDLKGKAEWKPDKKAASSTFTIRNSSGKTTEIGDLSGYYRRGILSKQVGSGRGYHGIKQFDGVPLRAIVEKAESGDDQDKVLVVTSADGYRSLLSFGEVFLGTKGERIIVSDNNQNIPHQQENGFSLVVPDDFLADRMVKTVRTIEVIQVKSEPRVYVIGVGCGDTSLITLEAISYLGKADFFVAPEHLAYRFSKYMGGKPILFDPFSSYDPFFRKKNPGLKEDEVKKRLEEQHAAEMKSLWDAVKAGKSVAVLDYGDPTIYGGWENWLLPEFADYIKVVTGINSFSAANTMFGGNIASNRNSMVLTTPWALQANEAMIKAVAAGGDTLAIFMGLKELNLIVPLLKSHYPETVPVTIAYRAGYSQEERLLKTTLGELLETASKVAEQNLGLIYVGL